MPSIVTSATCLVGHRGAGLWLWFLRASLVFIAFFFGYQKWFQYEADALIPYISHGPLASAVTWVGGWVGLGYVLSHTVTEMAARLGVRLIVFFLAPFALYVLFHRARRHHVIRLFRQARMSPDEISAALGKRGGTDLPPAEEPEVGALHATKLSMGLSGEGFAILRK